MIRSLTLAWALALAAAGAQAQVRAIPDEARRGEMTHQQGMIVLLNGAQVSLAPGARIRGPDNLIVLPAALPPQSIVKYTLDAGGMVQQVWIMTPQERAQPDPRK